MLILSIHPQEHTQDGLIICGGKEDLQGCSTLQPDGVWLRTHDLIKARKHHSSWEMEDGVILIGGGNSPDDTELGKLKLYYSKIIL